MVAPDRGQVRPGAHRQRHPTEQTRIEVDRREPALQLEQLELEDSGPTDCRERGLDPLTKAGRRWDRDRERGLGVRRRICPVVTGQGKAEKPAVDVDCRARHDPRVGGVLLERHRPLSVAAVASESASTTRGGRTRR